MYSNFQKLRKVLSSYLYDEDASQSFHLQFSKFFVNLLIFPYQVAANLWYNRRGQAELRAAMSKIRFLEPMHFFRFDNKDTREERKR